jgi:hypothetical protein
MPGASRSHRAPAIAVLAVALLAHFGWLLADRGIQSDDSPTYTTPARHLAHGDGFRNTNGLFETRRTPGYPIFLVPFVDADSGLLAAVAVQHLISALMAMAVFLFLDRRLGDRTAALAAGFYTAVDGASVIHANQILSETLFTAVVFVAFLLLARGRAAAGGLVASVAVLIRPIGLYLAVPVALVLLFRRAWLQGAAFILCFALLPLAWSARNAARGAGFTISTITSWSLLYDRAAATLAVGDPGDFTANVLARRNQLMREVGDPPPATYSNHVLRLMDHFHTERYGGVALRTITQHPLAYVRADLVALARTLFSGGATQLHNIFGVPLRAAQLAVGAWNLMATLIAAGGFVVLCRRDRDLALLSFAFVAYFLVTCSMAEATSRFRVPVVPMLAIWFGAGVSAMLMRLRRRPSATGLPG